MAVDEMGNRVNYFVATAPAAEYALADSGDTVVRLAVRFT
jgi:hypothetical protein